METVHRVRTKIIQILKVFIICLFILMTIIGIYQIVTHYFFNKSSTISEELLAYNFAQIALLASTYVFDKRDHMGMGFLADKIDGSVKKYLKVIISLLTFTFADVIVAYGGIFITKLTMIQTTASLKVSTGCIYVVVPITDTIIMVSNLMNATDMLHADFSKKESVGV